MLVRHVTSDQLYKALRKTNESYDGNIVFKRSPEKFGMRIRFTLTVNSTSKPGHRLGFQGQKVSAACWHVHGKFFDNLFAINPDAEILSNGQKITASHGNWVDRNLGVIDKPVFYSKLCECNISK